MADDIQTSKDPNEPKLQRAELPFLVVFAHGWESSENDLAGLAQITKEALTSQGGEPSVIHYSYDAQTFSDKEPDSLSKELATKIAESWDKAKHRGIILVGHSIGALLLRKAYLLGKGLAENDQHGNANLYVPFDRTGDPERNHWTSNVVRMVLLASPNRGWQLSFKNQVWSPEKSEARLNFWSQYLPFLTYYIIARALPSKGKLILSCRYGAPFISNLRLLGMQHAEAFPAMYFIHGDCDEIVKTDDYKDMFAGSGTNIRFNEVGKTGHKDIIFTDPPPGKTLEDLPADKKTTLANRKKVFTLAISGDTTDTNWSAATLTPQRKDVLVFMLHGIKTGAPVWPENLASKLRRTAAQKNKTIEVNKNSYGRTTTYQFLWPPYQAKQIRWYMDEITQTLARNPSTEVVFVGHSFGTFLLGQALQTYRSLKFSRILLMGSILPRDYDWNKLTDVSRIGYVRNDCQDKDIVLALTGPGLLKSLGKFGGSGLAGFTKTNKMAQAWMSGWHSVPTSETYWDSVTEFALESTPEHNVSCALPQPLNTKGTNGFILFAYYSCEFLWGTILYNLGPRIIEVIYGLSCYFGTNPLSLIWKIIRVFG